MSAGATGHRCQASSAPGPEEWHARPRPAGGGRGGVPGVANDGEVLRAAELHHHNAPDVASVGRLTLNAPPRGRGTAVKVASRLCWFSCPSLRREGSGSCEEPQRTGEHTRNQGTSERSGDGSRGSCVIPPALTHSRPRSTLLRPLAHSGNRRNRALLHSAAHWRRSTDRRRSLTVRAADLGPAAGRPHRRTGRTVRTPSRARGSAAAAHLPR